MENKTSTQTAKIKKEKDKKTKPSFLFLFLAFFLLTLGFVFIYIEKNNYIENYFRKKIPLRSKKLITYKRHHYKIGFITDIHAYRTQKGDALEEKISTPLQSFVDDMKIFKPDFIMDGGDFIDGSRRNGQISVLDFQITENFLKQINSPYYFTLGNHDIRGIEKNDWLELTGYKNTYYYIDKPGLRIIVMDSNFKPEDGKDLDVKPKRENYYTRGYVSKNQLAWLEETLASAKKRKKIVFVHHPMLEEIKYREGTALPKDADEVRDIFSKYSVNAVFSGHVEELYYEKIDGVSYYVIPGFYKSKDDKLPLEDVYKGVFSEIDIYNDINIKMFYKKPNKNVYENKNLPTTFIKK